ncbi:unnamed protein product [Didymodactylos carnosus]|uniref:Uncharacterized protein n=1 Tax=Didymodactylos carnosus TaxID=1234261 RepID=A0A8S2YJ34_9BILA|nr:unnamed protein product [Didymodactylos carnosus]
MVELLLNYSANPNQGDLKQITPFDLGASNDMMLKILRRELVIDRQDDSQDEDDENDELGPLSPLSSFECEQDIATTAILSLSPNATTSGLLLFSFLDTI